MRNDRSSAALVSLAALLLLGGTAGCGDNILLQTSYSLRDTAGGSFGNGTGGGGQGYTTAPQWPVTVNVSVFAAKNTQEETPVISISSLTLTPPAGSACIVGPQPSCSLTCAFELTMSGPGPCVVRMDADTAEGKVSQCFSYTLSPSAQFESDSDKAVTLCGD